MPSNKPHYFRPAKRTGLYRMIGWMLLLLLAIVLMLAHTRYFRVVFAPGPLLKTYLQRLHAEL